MIESRESGVVFSGGEIRRSFSKETCRFELDDAGNTSGIYIIDAKDQLFIPKAYGSGDELSIIDMNNCQKIPFNLDAYRFHITNSSILTQANCEKSEIEKQCVCKPAKIISLNDKCELEENNGVENQKTKKELQSLLKKCLK